MKKIIPILLFVLSMSFVPLFKSAKAQAEAPLIVDTTIPVSAEVRSSVEAWLGLFAPVPLQYWAITYVQPHADGNLVSIAALNIASPSDPWRMVDSDTVTWMGTVFVHADQTVEMYSTEPEPQAFNPLKISAMPTLGLLVPGGGSYLRFPWQAGGTMMYGPRGIHAAGGGGAYANGFSAVDFVGGDDMGSGVAPSRAYAVISGTVDYVCADDTTTLVRTHSTSTNDYFIYAHLLDNANLEMDHNFSTGGLIGSLKYGSFNDNCGWAEQADKHYHLHFGFQPANSVMRLEGCILSMSNAKWTCGMQTVSAGQFLVGGGGSGSSGSGTGEDGSASSIAQPSFFDYVLVGLISIWDKMVTRVLPSHTATQFTYVIYSSAKLAIMMAYVLVRSNVNLGPLMACFLIGTTVKLTLSLAEFGMFILKSIKSLVPEA